MTSEDFRMPDLNVLAMMMASGAGKIRIRDVADACPEFANVLKHAHPLKAAATFGALLTQKKFQQNCLRLEILVHISIAMGFGAKAPTSDLLLRGFNSVGRAKGHLEDPAEDVFIGNIESKLGNYLVLNGLWESATFYLQRFVNLVDSLPSDDDYFSNIKNSVHALLKISHLVCVNAKLHRNELGSDDHVRTLPGSVGSKSNTLRNIVKFNISELEKEGVQVEALSPFIFNPSNRSHLLDQTIGHTDLELTPLGVEDDDLYLLLPTAVTVAIRRFILNTLGSEPNHNLFVRHLGREYSALFGVTPFLGEEVSQVKFIHQSWGSFSAISTEIDEGHYLALVFTLDTLKDFDEEGFNGIPLPNVESQEIFTQLVQQIQSEISKRQAFKSGITLFVNCGIGRSSLLVTENGDMDKWSSIFLSAPDFCTLSRTPKMKALNLWRIEEMKNRLTKQMVDIQEINGFLNLYAWAESLDGHLVPHSEIPEDHDCSKPLNLIINQNSLLDLRHKVANLLDSHVERYVDGSWYRVQIEGKNLFEEDSLLPSYVHIPLNKAVKPIGVFITEHRCWWYELSLPNENTETRSHDRWRMLQAWIEKSAIELDAEFGSDLGKGPILWRCAFEYEQRNLQEEFKTFGTADDARDAIKITVDSDSRIIEFRITKQFDRALFHPENIAEKELVNALIKGVALLANREKYDINKIIQEIIPNAQARQTHMLPAREFRDFIPELHSKETVYINRLDDASIRLGMGWLAYPRKAGGRVEGKENCIQFLNTLVAKLEDQLCTELRQFDRVQLMSKIIYNLEVASHSRDRWHRTAAAILGMRKDKNGALKTMRDIEQKLNGVLQSSRNLLEMSICESPLEGGTHAGDLELSKLMAQASLIFHFGGLSDLVRWDMMEPLFIIRPLGDVHANHDVLDEIIVPFGAASSEHRYMASVKDYAKRLESPKFIAETDKELFGDFLNAWQDEFGLDFEAYRRFIDAIEAHAIEQRKAIVQLTLGELCALADSIEVGMKIVESMKLIPRTTWRTLPEPYVDKDIATWKFRRRLSSLRRPLLQINTLDEPLFLIAPGTVREGFVSMVTNYYDGSYSDAHLGKAMRQYAGNIRRKTGTEFNALVSKRMSDLGWQVLPEIKLTKILQTSLDRDYGDIDVLAWNITNGRLLVIECKDLQFRKTYGEIAEQLNDFRGQTYSNGKGDLLKKHLDRVDVLKSQIDQVKKFLKMDAKCSIESHLIFRNPVPMQYVQGPIRSQVKCNIYDNLHTL